VLAEIRPCVALGPGGLGRVGARFHAVDGKLLPPDQALLVTQDPLAQHARRIGTGDVGVLVVTGIKAGEIEVMV